MGGYKIVELSLVAKHWPSGHQQLWKKIITSKNIKITVRNKLLSIQIIAHFQHWFILIGTCSLYTAIPEGMVDIYRDAKRSSPTLRGIVVLVFTKSDGWENASSISSSETFAPFFSPFAKQWISKVIPSYGSQWKRAKIAFHWFGIY